MNGAQWLVKFLIQNGVTEIFGYPGGAIMPFYDALYKSKLKHLLFRHEQGAIMAAIGYARASNKIGVCVATSGPGATNLITGLSDALLDSVPIIVITGQVDSKLIGTDSFQEVDILGMSLACTKYSFLVNSIEDLQKTVNDAFYIAKNNRPGPVLIDIPKDIQLKKICSNFNYVIIKDKKSLFINKITDAKNIIMKSKKPILYIGGGVFISKATKEVRKLSYISGIPSVCTLKGLGVLTSNDYYYLGMIGMHGNKSANLAVQRSDLLIAIGARFDDRVTGKIDTFAPNAKIIHIDIDESEFNKIRVSDICLLGDIKYLLSNLYIKPDIISWQNEITILKKKYQWNYNYIGKKIYAPFLLKLLSEKININTIITTDVGQHQMWVAQHIEFKSPNSIITSGGLGSMGFGIPAAIGAKIAKPSNQIICISGDGSFMMNVQELCTIKRRKIAIKIILIDNNRLGMVRQWQELFFCKRYSETNLDDNPDFITLSKSFGINGHSISLKEEINSSLEILLNYDGPYILHVIIDELENVWPLVPPGSSNENMIEKKYD